MITPPSPITNELYLLHMPFDSSYKNVLYFQSYEEQSQYMKSHIITIWDANGQKVHLSFDNCQYIRKDGTLKIPVHIDRLYHCNYVMYRNPYQTEKWFYAFVVNQRYINDNCTELTIATDVFSTWQREMIFRPSFVEREHTSDDTIGMNTIPEGLETGPFIVDYEYNIQNYLDPVTIIAYMGDTLDGVSLNTAGGLYNGVPSAVPFLLTTYQATTPLVRRINNEGNGDKIFCIFTVPKLAVYDYLNDSGVISSLNQHAFAQFPEQIRQSEKTVLSLERPKRIDGYTPRNKKLLTYPYCYLGFTAPNGSSKIYRYEHFSGGGGRTIQFKGISEINPSPTVLFIPQYYMGRTENIPEASIVNGYPTLSYKNDYYNTWLAQNSQLVNLSVDRANFNYDVSQARTTLARDRENSNYMYDMMGNIIGGVGNLLSLNLGGLASNIVGGMQGTANHGFNMRDIGINAQANRGNWQYDIKTINAQVEKQSMLPDTGVLSSSNATLLGYNYFGKACFTKFSIKSEYAYRIDQYFDMFGYQTNAVKIPNLNCRENWNYVKTINANIEGKIPLPDLLELKNIFDSGVTLWHNPKTLYNYHAQNRIVIKRRPKRE